MGIRRERSTGAPPPQRPPGLPPGQVGPFVPSGRRVSVRVPRLGLRARSSARLLFVTGGSGFLGRHIVTGLESQRWEIIAPDSRGLDLRNPASVRSVIRDWRPTAIIHTAYRRGDQASIVDASRHVAEAATATRARLVHVSSDVVFRGSIARYTEHDRPDPITEYDRDKADAELAVATACPEAVIVRTSLLLGRDQIGAHEQTVLDAITHRTPMTFFTDEIRCPVLVDDVATALVQLARRRDITGVLHLASSQPMSRAELAQLIALRHGWDVSRIRTGTMAEAGLVRPGRVVLDSGVARSHGLAVRGPRDW